MVTHTSARLSVLFCALALSTGAGVAFAEPDLGPFVNTTCTYSQAEAALIALSPDHGKEFADSPMTQTWLHAFLDTPVQQRSQLIQQAPQLTQYTGLLIDIANTCKSYPTI